MKPSTNQSNEPFAFSADALAAAWPNIDLREGLSAAARKHNLSEGTERLLRRIISRLALLLNVSFNDVKNTLDTKENDFNDVLTLAEAAVVKPVSVKRIKAEREQIAVACNRAFELVRDGFVTGDHLDFKTIEFASGAAHGCVRACWRLAKLIDQNDRDMRTMTLDQALDELSFTAKSVLVLKGSHEGGKKTKKKAA